ncbi:hypothetical protein V8F33_001600 [Rhypophila sp. PSN 637]
MRSGALQGSRIKITVGSDNPNEPRPLTFSIHKNAACYHSLYFRAALRGSRFLEAQTGEFHLPDDSPEDFRRWVEWLYSCEKCKRGTVDFSRSHVHGCEVFPPSASWCKSFEMDLIFADRISL